MTDEPKDDHSDDAKLIFTIGERVAFTLSDFHPGIAIGVAVHILSFALQQYDEQEREHLMESSIRALRQILAIYERSKSKNETGHTGH